MNKLNSMGRESLGTLNSGVAFEEKIKKHQGLLYSLAGALLLAGAVFFGYKKLDEKKIEKLNEELFCSIFAIESGRYKDALEGEQDTPGLKEISKKYKNSKGVSLVNYYLGVASMKSHDFDGAIQAFKKINFKDLVMQAMVYGLVGDCLVEKNDFDGAVLFYEKAIQKANNSRIVPVFIVKMAIVEEQRGNKEAALKLYKKVLHSYSDYEPYVMKRHIARLE